MYNARYLVNLSIDPTDTGILYRRSKILIEQSEILVRTQLDKMKSLESCPLNSEIDISDSLCREASVSYPGR